MKVELSSRLWCTKPLKLTNTVTQLSFETVQLQEFVSVHIISEEIVYARSTCAVC